MQFTLELVQKRFPEARESFGGFGKCFRVHCTRFHRSGGFYEMEIQASNGWFRCHNCGYKGWAKDEWFSREINDFHHLWFEREQERRLQALANKATVRRSGVMWGDSLIVEAPGEMVPFATLPDEHPAVEYLRNRRFDIEEIKAFEPVRALYYCTRGYEVQQGLGSTTGRIIFPVYKDGIIQGWQARQVEREDKEKGERFVWNGYTWRQFHRTENGRWEDHYVGKYLFNSKIPRYSLLYNWDVARTYPVVAVVEGPLDQLAVGPACVATFGKSVTMEQIRMIKNIDTWQKVFYIRDPEVDTTTTTYRNMIAEMSGLDLYQIVIPGNRDPGETPRDEIWAIIARAIEERARGTALYPSLS